MPLNARSLWSKKSTPHLLLQTPCPFTWCPVPQTPPISRPSPLPPTETGGKATKTTTNTIYMIYSTSFPFVSLAVEDPPDLSWHHLHDDREICKTTSYFITPFPLNQSVESTLPIKYHIPSPCLSNDLHLGKGAYLFVDSDGQLLENLCNGLYLKKFYA